ncbi:Homeodomain-like DNA binding domain-containing transcription factor [Mucor lusitanicus]|uniref:Homeodomain-like DNA binding domain-containing transcription factor n=1 Tax=Mucor circinelloides f. lusitanicus TaxID=29924 RepID=A0A8H4BE02_MUCCL|nr:Homeodomain-like DNA binding domain-containing transcription factor [Mucor lusitanicus]
MIINQTRIETPAQTFVPNSTSANSKSFITYVRREKANNVIELLSSDEEDLGDEEPVQSTAQPMDGQLQTVNLSASTRPTKQRKIEGSQNAPISLDDSDDDMAEIIDPPASSLDVKKGPIDSSLPQSIASSAASSPMAAYDDYGDDQQPMDEAEFQLNLEKYFGLPNEDKKDELNGESTAKPSGDLNNESDAGLHPELSKDMPPEMKIDVEELGEEVSKDVNQEINDRATDESDREMISESAQEEIATSTEESNVEPTKEMIAVSTEDLNVESTEQVIAGSTEESNVKPTEAMVTESTEDMMAGSTEKLKIGLQGGLNSGLIGEFTYAVNEDFSTGETSDDAMAIDNPMEDQIMDQHDAHNKDLVNNQNSALMYDHLDDHLDDSFSVLSELSDVAFEQLSRMSVRENSVKDEELHNALNITETMTQLTVDEALPSTTVNTFIPDNVEKLELLRMMEMYIQSVSEPPAMASATDITDRSRRSRRHTESSSPVVYYRQKSNVDSQTQAQPTLHPQEPNTPYVPSRVWYNSTWEDWAQLDTADILHYPFTTQEIAIIEHCIYRFKGSRIARDPGAYWQYVSTQLPGRTPLDCKCFYSDLKDGQYKLFDKVIMVRKYKAQKKGRSRYQLLSKRTRTGALNGNALRSIHWANMSRESTIQGGSGDAITLAIFNDPTKGVRIAAGSLCDENIQYNVPGNLRLWDSETNDCKSLSGHQTVHETTGQEIWRTVTDVKMSKDQSLIYSSSHDGRANIWRAKTGKHVSTLSYHSKPINQLAVNYSTNENVLATCSNDGTATVWTLSRNGKTGSGVICELDSGSSSGFHSDPHVDCVEFGHDATNGVLFLGVNTKDVDRPGYVETYDISSGKPHTRYDSMHGCVSTLAVSSSGRYIVSGNYNRFDNMTGDRFIHLHDSRKPKVVSKFYSGHPDVNVVAISPCERYVASGNAEKEKSEVVIFDVRNARKSLHLLSHDQTLVDQSLIAPDSSIGIGGLHWMSDSRIIVTGGGDSMVKVWNIEGATELLKSYPAANCVTSLAVNEDTMTIAAGVAGAQGIVHVWQP